MSQPNLLPARLRTLADRFPGDVITAHDPRYGPARQLWNAAVDHRPAAILRPANAAAAGRAVLEARALGLDIAVRGGGHSVAGHSMADGGVTIDLSRLRRVTVDPRARRARVGGGALLMDVIEAAEPHALTIPFGHVSHTGVGGLTLGGGIGWTMRRHGLTVDSLRAAEVVTADGGTVRASETENPDLFWALRGGGGNFGIVTELEFDLHPFGPSVLAGMIVHPLERAAEAMRFCRDFMDSAPDELTTYEMLMTAPPADPFPAELQGRPALAIGVVHCGPVEEGREVLRPLLEHGRPALTLVEPMPPTAVQTMLDDTAPHGMRNHNRSHWLRGLPDDAVDELVALHAEVTSPRSAIITARMGGAIERVPADATAYAHRDAQRLLWVVSSWLDADDDRHIAWCRRVFDAMTPHSTGGVYVNALGDESPARVRAGYGEQTWSRLRLVKAAWDPDNVFRLNQNIPPAEQPARAA